jgi:hypothetical protein
MKKIYLLQLLAVVALSITSCGKDGATGPVGPAGTQGAAGATGAVGATGADGTKIYSGTTAPTATLGINGDFYINVATSGFYGPKTAAGWGSPFSLKGATGATGATGAAGADGTDGSTIKSGNVAPGAAVGANGDYYLNTATYLFYGPKIGGTWPAPINLKGPKGDPGTANVIYSDWFTPAAYVKTTVFSTSTFTFDVAEPKITQDILDKGVVVVYGKLNGYNPVIWPTNQVAPLPIVINYLSGTTPEIDTWSGLYSLGNVQISMKNNTNAYSNISNAHSYRYVIIPGGVHIAAVKLKNYNELKAALHIQD